MKKIILLILISFCIIFSYIHINNKSGNSCIKGFIENIISTPKCGGPSGVKTELYTIKFATDAYIHQTEEKNLNLEGLNTLLDSTYQILINKSDKNKGISSKLNPSGHPYYIEFDLNKKAFITTTTHDNQLYRSVVYFNYDEHPITDWCTYGFKGDFQLKQFSYVNKNATCGDEVTPQRN